MTTTTNAVAMLFAAYEADPDTDVDTLLADTLDSIASTIATTLHETLAKPGSVTDRWAYNALKRMGVALKALDAARDAIHYGLPDEAAQAVLRAQAAVDTSGVAA